MIELRFFDDNNIEQCAYFPRMLCDVNWAFNQEHAMGYHRFEVHPVECECNNHCYCGDELL